jgi:hypothetical protein
LELGREQTCIAINRGQLCRRLLQLAGHDLKLLTEAESLAIKRG